MSKRDTCVARTRSQRNECGAKNAKRNDVEPKAQNAKQKQEARARFKAEIGKVEQFELATAEPADIELADEETWDPMSVDTDEAQVGFTHSRYYFRSQIPGSRLKPKIRPS